MCGLLAVMSGCRNATLTSPNSPRELSTIAGYKGTAPNRGDVFRFAILSDRTNGRQEGLWAQVVGEVNRLKPDFVICVGDLVEAQDDDGEQIWLQGWDEFHQELSGLQAPFFYCSGNHDVSAPAARKVYTKLHGVNGRTYYSFNYHGCHFVVLDSTIWHNKQDLAAGKAQMEWLGQDLAGARSARHTFIFVHHPLFEEPVWKDVLATVDRKRSTFFSGHWHTMMSMQPDGVQYYVVGATATHRIEDTVDLGLFRQFDFVTVQDGDPTIAVVPIGQIVPPDWIDETIDQAFRDALTNISLTTVKAGGGESTLHIANNSSLEVAYQLTWNRHEKWLDPKVVKSETVKVAPKSSATRTYRVPSVPENEPAPQLEVQCQFTVKNKSRAANWRLTLPVEQELVARRLAVTVDGKLDEWTGTKAWALNLITGFTVPSASTSPNGASVRVAYDDKNLYLAIKVRDNHVVTEGREPWQRDGVEIFWDPRPANEQNGPFTLPCRQLLLPVPAEGKPLEVFTNPQDQVLSKAVRVQMVRDDEGYVLEAAIPLSCIAKDFVAAPGKSLRIDISMNDKDAPMGQNTIRTLSGYIGASRKTDKYCPVKFE
jgi:3',5'-cyclic AMP phosphodiesterase CpdA